MVIERHKSLSLSLSLSLQARLFFFAIPLHIYKVYVLGRGAILSLLSRLRLQDEGQASVHIQSAIMVLSSLLETFHILGVRVK